MLGIPRQITSSAIRIKICAGITSRIKKYKSIIKKNKTKHDKTVLLAKLNSIEVLISKTWINSSTSHDEFVSENNVLKEYDDMKQVTKIVKT